MGENGRFATNVKNKQNLFDMFNEYIEFINSQVPTFLKIDASF